jgi:hypothetical protein
MSFHDQFSSQALENELDLVWSKGIHDDDRDMFNGLFDHSFSTVEEEELGGEASGVTDAAVVQQAPLLPQQTRPSPILQQYVPSTTCIHMKTTQTPEDVEKSIAEDLTRLSMQEREQAMDDLHGIIHHHKEEQPEILEGLLLQLQKQLDSMIWLPNASAYRRAVQQDPEYVESKRKLFLRADRYQPLEAAQRMLRFFELKRELWGAEKLCKKITIIDDFSDHDREALDQGFLTISPYTDSAKRVIVYVNAPLRRVDVHSSVLRAQYYIYMSLVEDDEETQRRGVVLVALDISPDYRSQGMAFRDTIPVFFAALHAHVSEQPETVTVITNQGVVEIRNASNKKKSISAQVHKVPVIMRQAAKEQSLPKRVRYRSYNCAREEALRRMLTFGIPMSAAPLAVDGRYDLQGHLQWVEKRIDLERKEKTPTVPSTIDVPTGGSDALSVMTVTEHCIATTTTAATSDGMISGAEIRNDDVLFGKEKKVVNHPGNAKFRQVIDHYFPAYEAAPRGEKTNITRVIVDHIHGLNGRFLKRGSPNLKDTWVEVDTETSYDKITHAFRNRRKYQANRPRPFGS